MSPSRLEPRDKKLILATCCALAPDTQPAATAGLELSSPTALSTRGMLSAFSRHPCRTCRPSSSQVRA